MEEVDGVDDLVFQNLRQKKPQSNYTVLVQFTMASAVRERTHQQVDDPEVLLQAVAHEADARVDEEAQLQVRGLERGQVLGGDLGVQVSRFDARVLGQVVHHLEEERGGDGSEPELLAASLWGRRPLSLSHLLLGGDVVVDEGHPLVLALAPHAGDPGHRHLAGLDGGLGAVTAELRLLLHINRDRDKSITVCDDGLIRDQT